MGMAASDYFAWNLQMGLRGWGPRVAEGIR